MITLIKLFATIMGFIFPVMLIKAIGCSNDDPEKGKYTALASVCFGILVFILMGFMPGILSVRLIPSI